MRRIFPALLPAFILFTLPLGAQTGGEALAGSPGRSDPIDINLIIDGSRHTGETGAQAWICEYLLDGMFQEGDYLRIWIAGEEAAVLYQGLLGADNRELIRELIQRPLPGSASVDFAGALRAAQGAGVSESRSPLFTYTLLVSSPIGLSPAHLGAALPYLRYSRVLDFSGWRALVIALDISRQVREAAGLFLSNG
jgi:hypothetical protein